MTSGENLQSYISMISSLIAIGISSLTLGWTIYRDAIRKPKFRVDVAVKKLVRKGEDAEGPYLFIEALNLGPIPNRVGLTFARKNWIKRRILDRKTGTAMIYPDFGHWAATKASTRLEVGDTANFIFPYEIDCFLNDDFIQVGVADGFGQIHWSTRRDLQTAKKRYRKDFDAKRARYHQVSGAYDGGSGTDNGSMMSPPAKGQEYYHSYKG